MRLLRLPNFLALFVTLTALTAAIPFDHSTDTNASAVSNPSKTAHGNSLDPFRAIHAARLGARSVISSKSQLTTSAGCATNAECLQRELPILKPRGQTWGRSGSRQKLSPRQSGVPPISGTIQVVASTGSILGCVALVPGQGYYGISQSVSEAVGISLIPGLPQQSATITAGLQAGFPFLAVGGLEGEGLLLPDVLTYSIFVGASVELPAGPADRIETSFGMLPAETGLLDSATDELSLSWTNDDDVAKISAQLFYNTALNEFPNEGIVPITLKLVPTAA